MTDCTVFPSFEVRRGRQRQQKPPHPLQHVANVTARVLGISPPPMVLVKPYNRGRTYLRLGRLSVPEWAIERSLMYAVAYTVHEVVHFHPGATGHGPTFRRVERKALKHWGIKVPRYGQVYAAAFETRFGHTIDRYGHRVSSGPLPW